jgi:tyrosine-specific transport protein
VGWITYLFLLYSLTTAYLAGSGPIIIECVEALTGYVLPAWSGALPLFAIFGYFVYQGTRSVDYLNRVLMIGLGVAYVFLVLFLTPHVQLKMLSHIDTKYLLISVAIVATSFGYHIIIPSLTVYMERDISSLKKAIWIGSLIPLAVYIIWELLTLGIIPLTGNHSIASGYDQGVNGAHLLSEALNNSYIVLIARFLKIEKTQGGRPLLFVLTFLPPLVFALADSRAFLTALEYAGAFGVVTLLGLLPALMAWSNRYWKKRVSPYRVQGGKGCLILVAVFSALVMFLELANKAGLIKMEQYF